MKAPLVLGGIHSPLAKSMSSSVESTFEKNPESERSAGSARTDADKTVIRQDELLDAPSLDTGTDRHFSHLAFRQSASQLMGQQLDHFRIESLVGTGGMGAVFCGRDLKLDREVAIKVVPIADRGAGSRTNHVLVPLVTVAVCLPRHRPHLAHSDHVAPS